MSDFIDVNGEDFVDFIKTEEDMVKWNRMKELEKEFHKPATECLDALIEYDHLCSDLKGIPRRKFIKMGDPQLN